MVRNTPSDWTINFLRPVCSRLQWSSRLRLTQVINQCQMQRVTGVQVRVGWAWPCGFCENWWLIGGRGAAGGEGREGGIEDGRNWRCIDAPNEFRGMAVYIVWYGRRRGGGRLGRGRGEGGGGRGEGVGVVWGCWLGGKPPSQPAVAHTV